MAIFCLVGVAFIRASHAGSFFMPSEAEGGEIKGSAQAVTDPSASAGAAVRFDSQPVAAGGRFGMAEGGQLQHLSATELASYLDDYKKLGVQWVRTDIDWLRVQAAGQTNWDWAAYDQVVDAITVRGMQVVGILAYPPDWAKSDGCTNNYDCRPRNPSDFAAFAQAAANRYKPKGVHVWEVWNEPNGGRFTPAQYAELLRATYPAVKTADPQAQVLAGGSMPAATSDNDYSPVDFLQGMYVAGSKGYFDALTHHPYCWGGGDAFDCPTAFADWSAWSQIEETNPSLRSTMVANGDGDKKIWLTEMGAPVQGNAGHVSEANQAKEVTDAYNLVKTKAWAGPLFWYSYKDTGADPTNSEHWFGLLRSDGTQRPSYAAYKAASGSP